MISVEICAESVIECFTTKGNPRTIRDRFELRNYSHPRFVFVQIFKEEEEAVKVDLHEGCGRIKLYWTMALTDYRTLKGLVEFKEAGNGEISVLCISSLLKWLAVVGCWFGVIEVPYFFYKCDLISRL